MQVIEVEAASEEEAIAKALEVAEEHLMDTTSITYDCPEVEESEVMEAEDGS